MTQRLTPELEAEIRSELGGVPGYIAHYLRPLLGEVDALRAERDRLRGQLDDLEDIGSERAEAYDRSDP